jgi:branched-chain amino acid transport system ATP-binding protein
MPTDAAEYLLDIRNLTKRFGGLTAVRKLSFRVRKGQIKAIIGPNGAGKTTVFNMISGLLRPSEGERLFKGVSIEGLMPHEIAALGISRTFQNVLIFDNLTVLQNVMVGRHTRSGGEFLYSGIGVLGSRGEEKRIRKKACAFLEMVGLDGKASEMAGNLPFGEQRLLEIGRALATEPDLLLLDEPAAGLNEKETEELARLIKSVQRLGITVLLVEHDMNLVMDISENILVLNYGEMIAEGVPSEIQQSTAVIEAYLGGGEYA